MAPAKARKSSKRPSSSTKLSSAAQNADHGKAIKATTATFLPLEKKTRHKQGISKSFANSHGNFPDKDAPRHGMITRVRLRQIRNVFPILKLPGEIRNLIYQAALNFSDLEKTASRRLSQDKLKTLPRHTPPLLLLNHQTHLEAKGILYCHKTLTFEKFPTASSCGPLDERSTASSLISKGVLRQVQHIVFRNRGQNTEEDWATVLWDLEHLIKYLVSVWVKDGQQKHSLKTLQIDVGDEAVANHIIQCNAYGAHCAIQNWYSKIMNSLRELQHLEFVEFTGPICLIENAAEELQRRLTYPKSLLLNLPVDVRKRIYGYVLGEFISSRQLTVYQRNVIGHPMKVDDRKASANITTRTRNGGLVPPITAKIPTPAVLTVNKQVYSEVKDFLLSTPLVFSEPLDLFTGGALRWAPVALPLRDFSRWRIMRRTDWENTILQINYVTIEIDAPKGRPGQWASVIRAFADLCCDYHIRAPGIRLVPNSSASSGVLERRMKEIMTAVDAELALRMDYITFVDDFTSTEFHEAAIEHKTITKSKAASVQKRKQKYALPRPSVGGLRLPLHLQSPTGETAH